MLVLTRRIGEEVVIGQDIVVTVVAIHGDKIRLGITAPETIPIDRREVRERREQFADKPRSIRAASDCA
jgi:carbon storage regulator